MNAVRSEPLTVQALVGAVDRMRATERTGPDYVRLSPRQANDLLNSMAARPPGFPHAVTVRGLPVVIANSASDIERRAHGETFWQFGWRG